MCLRCGVVRMCALGGVLTATANCGVSHEACEECFFVSLCVVVVACIVILTQCCSIGTRPEEALEAP
jgi:hypothetical protein